MVRDDTPKPSALRQLYSNALPVKLSKFSSPSVFSNAVRLLALQSMPTLKTLNDPLDLFIRLQGEGFDESVLFDFKQFCKQKYPGLLTPKGFTRVLSSLVNFHGYRLAGGEMCYTLEGERSPRFTALELF